MKLFELKQLRNQKKAEARKVTANAESRDLTPEEDKAFNALMDEVTKLDSRITAIESTEPGDDEANAVSPAAEDDNTRSGGRVGSELSGRSGISSGNKHRYSLMKVVRHIGGEGKLDGLEAEVHKELRKRRENPTKGVLVPHRFSGSYRDAGDMLNEERAIEAMERRAAREYRDLTTSTGSGGIAAILGTDFIDILRAKMVTQTLGARVLSDMTGSTFSLPKKTAKGTTYWVTEGTAPTNSNMTIGQVTFTPKTVGAVTDLSRKFMLQTSLSADQLVKDDLIADMAVEIDRVGISGSGSGAEPLGILADGAIASLPIGTNGGVPTWDLIVNLETAVGNLNADTGKMAYLTSPKGRGILKRSLRGANTYGIYLWNDENEVNNYSAYASTNIPSNITKGTGTGLTSLIFGNWESLTYALWGGFDLIEDPYTKSNVGGLRLVALQDIDVQKRYTESFAVIPDINPA